MSEDMGKDKGTLKLTITNSNGVKHRYLRGKDQLIIGRNLHTEVPIFSQHYPKKHVLLKGQDDHFVLRIQDYMEGEIVFQDSTLVFKDLIKHSLLKKKGGCYLLKILPDRSGTVSIGDTEVKFSFDREAPSKADLPGYWRFHSHFKSLTRDVTFKLIFLFFLVINAAFVHRVNTVELPERKPLDIEQIPQRLARFIVKPPILKSRAKAGGEIAASRDTKEGATKKEAAGESASRGTEVARSVAGKGLLGLITGTGPISKPSAVIDFLVDRGLARELEDVLSNKSELKTNEGRPADSQEDLFSLLDLNVENPAVAMDEMERVELKKGRVNLDEAGEITGLGESMGWRSEESVREIILSHLNRITYTYNKFLKLNPELKGKIVLEITIAASGEIIDCKMVASTVNNPEFEQAILDIVQRWRFKPIPEGTVTVNYPFVFIKSG